MRKTSRRQVLKGGARGVLAAAALSVGASPAYASGRQGLRVHIHGVLSRGMVTLPVSIDVAGRPDNLAGAGWDAGTGTTGSGMLPGGNPPGGPIGACYYTVSGELEGNVVTLVGRSLFTNRPLLNADTEDPGKSDTRADGRLINVTADLDSGEIIWSLTVPGVNPDPFTGNGVVMLSHASQTSK